MYSKTKIIATIGPASNNYDKMKELVQNGVDVFRLNFSHGTHDDHEKVIRLVRKLNKELGLSVSILQDLQGPKIRTAMMENDGVEIKAGNKLILTNDNSVLGTSERVGVSYSSIAKDVAEGNLILMDDGKLSVRVLSTNGVDEVETVVEYGGILKSRKGVNLPHTKVSIPALTEKDREDLEFGLNFHLDWVALSFVRTAAEIRELRELIKVRRVDSRIIAKIEKPEAVENIDEIIAEADAIMVARGDLGVEVFLEEVPIIQKMIVAKCNEASKPVIIATQMMESMIDNPRPTRAETNDVASAVMEGTDAVMLSAETAAGKYPIETVKSINKTIAMVESRLDEIYDKHYPISEDSETYFNDNVLATACKLANDTNAQAIVGMTRSGYTAFELAKHRPKADIFIFTDNKYVLTRLNLAWGIRGFYYDKFTTTDETIKDIMAKLKDEGYIKTGDVLINTSSMPIGAQERTNTIKLSITQ